MVSVGDYKLTVPGNAVSYCIPVACKSGAHCEDESSQALGHLRPAGIAAGAWEAFCSHSWPSAEPLPALAIL